MAKYKYKKKYSNLHWFNQVIATEYKFLYDLYIVDYKNTKTVSFYSIYKKNGQPRQVFLIRRSSKNVYKICFSCESEIDYKSFKNCRSCLEYMKSKTKLLNRKLIKEKIN